MRLGPVLFIAVCVTLVAILFMVVGAARGLPRAPNPGPAGLIRAGDHPKRVGSAGAGLAEGLGRAPNPEPMLEARAVPQQQGRSGTGLAEGPAGGMASSYGPGLYGNRLACGGRLWPAPMRSPTAPSDAAPRCGSAGGAAASACSSATEAPSSGGGAST